MSKERDEALFVRALRIRYEHGSGYWLPIIEALAMRGHAAATVVLADWLCGEQDEQAFASCPDPRSPVRLYRRAWRQGADLAAFNLALAYFNRGDLRSYRSWLKIAARSGDGRAMALAKAFDTRLPHRSARKIRRLRPEKPRDLA